MFEPAELPADIDAIRRTTQGNYVLGSRRFAEEVAAMLGRRTTPGRRGRPAKPGRAMDLSG